MLLYLIGIFIFGCVVGSYWKSSQVAKAAKNKTFIVVDGELYKVSKHKNTHVGGD